MQEHENSRTRRRGLVAAVLGAAALAAAWDAFAHVTASAGHSHAVASDAAPRTIKWFGQYLAFAEPVSRPWAWLQYLS